MSRYVMQAALGTLQCSCSGLKRTDKHSRNKNSSYKKNLCYPFWRLSYLNIFDTLQFSRFSNANVSLIFKTLYFAVYDQRLACLPHGRPAQCIKIRGSDYYTTGFEMGH